ncbi:MAG: hypothetical protein ACK5Q5_17740 [Planctomycetaceae bacterium]
MSSQRYRRLLTNLPSMASVVNSFESQDVQREVYHILMEALDEVLGDEENKASELPSTGIAIDRPRRGSRKQEKSVEALADLMEGDSIHALTSDN